MFTYSSKLSIPKMFSMSTIWEILWIGPLLVNFKFTELLKNQVEWILPAVFNWRHLYANWWFSWDILSIIKSLPENRNCDRSEDLPFKFFRLNRTFYLCLRHLNLTMTGFRFLKQWHECSCSGVTLTPARDKALQTSSSKISSPRLSGTGFISIVSLLWFWEFITAFLSSWTILCNRWLLQFLDIYNSE